MGDLIRSRMPVRQYLDVHGLDAMMQAAANKSYLEQASNPPAFFATYFTTLAAGVRIDSIAVAPVWLAGGCASLRCTVVVNQLFRGASVLPIPLSPFPAPGLSPRVSATRTSCAQVLSGVKELATQELLPLLKGLAADPPPSVDDLLSQSQTIDRYPPHVRLLTLWLVSAALYPASAAVSLTPLYRHVRRQVLDPVFRSSLAKIPVPMLAVAVGCPRPPGTSLAPGLSRLGVAGVYLY
eukprot:350558_1